MTRWSDRHTAVDAEAAKVGMVSGVWMWYMAIDVKDAMDPADGDRNLRVRDRRQRRGRPKL